MPLWDPYSQMEVTTGYTPNVVILVQISDFPSSWYNSISEVTCIGDGSNDLMY